MNKNLLNVKKLIFSDNSKDTNDSITQITTKDIAIIGMSGVFGSASDYSEFWDSLRAGKDMVREFPEERKKHVDQYYRNKGAGEDHQKDYFTAAYLDRIDEFDYGHFSLSPKEADLMDPHQRMFLQTSWNAIEDSGYGGTKIKGTKTGVFVGYSADFGEDYREIIRTNDPDSLELAVVPNLRSIIASRIAYILDLTGPSLVVDTACSSSLTAVHLACKSLQKNECDMAIAGSIRLLLIPTKKDSEFRIGLEKILGVESDSGHARTFDETSDGTGLGEGMGALILKPLNKAVEDNDHIYAVIKGSALNQDGNSVGITAPNSEAQAKVIIQAWKDAGVEPETISYIEAHGTGTNLGDPIEINALQRAFRKYTDKKQFCGIGSLKTNFGHLDDASGTASIFKAVLSLVHREILPSLGFNYPNRKINFTDSPIYVNDTLRQWETIGYPRRCGISAFGLSGTNCHIILEEAPENNMLVSNSQVIPGILTLSASSMESLRSLIAEYQRFLALNSDIDMEALCYTANTGRGHYSYRLAIIVSDRNDLISKLNLIVDPEDIKDQKYIFYKEHRVVSTQNLVTSDREITDSYQMSLTSDVENLIEQMNGEFSVGYALPADICKLYVSGATVDWERYYEKQGKKIGKISIPVYPFARKACWVKTSDKVKNRHLSYKKEIPMPLIDNLKINMNDLAVYETVFSVEKDWVLNEHKILGQYLAPGTTYIEMIREVIRYYYNDAEFELSGVTFMSPMVVELGEAREVHTILYNKKDSIEFTISSKPELSEDSITHAVGKIVFSAASVENHIIDLDQIKSRMVEENINNIIQVESNRSDIEVGGRWDCARRIFSGNNEYLAFIELPDQYDNDLVSLIAHPSLMDCAVNVLNSMISDELYLPFTYKNIRFFDALPKSFWCYLRRKEKGSDETISFDIDFISSDEKLLAKINEYTIKKVNSLDFRSENANGNCFYQLGWKEAIIKQDATELPDGTILYFKGKNEVSEKIIAFFKNQGQRVIEVIEGECFEKLDEFKYLIDGSKKGYEELFKRINENSFSYIFHSYAINGVDENNGFESLNQAMQKSLYSLFYLTQTVISLNIKITGNIVLLCNQAYQINSREGTSEIIKPANTAYFGLAEVVHNEYSNLKLKCIDIDSLTGVEVLLDEIKSQDECYSISYRNNVRFIKELKQVNLNQYEESRFEVKTDGVYIVTGGTGALGLSVSKYFASMNKVKLCLINRSSFPSRENWDGILEDGNRLGGEVKKLAIKISEIREIEKNGSEVYFIKADVADQESTREAIESIKSKFGKINGIVHTAGVAGQGFVFNKEEKSFKEVIEPKILGTWLLDSLTREENPDFMILFSSISSFMGELGQGDYAASNAYMNSFSIHRNSMGYKTISINWPAWKETGMAVEFKVDFEKELFNPVNTKTALHIMEQVLYRKIETIVPSEINYRNWDGLGYKLPFDLSSRIDQGIKKHRTSKNVATAESKSSYSMIIRGKPEDKVTVIEKTLAQLWGKILGMEELNINDKFQSLGGDSILATELLKALEGEFPGMVDIADVFTYPTVAAMAGYIEGLQSDKDQLNVPVGGSLTMEDIFVRLERGEISPEEADRLISKL